MILTLLLNACSYESPQPPPTTAAPEPLAPRAEIEPPERTLDAAGAWPGIAPLVILVSFDGFRHDYQERVKTPALDRMAAEGVTTEGLLPVFPSKTFPNHYTQVTGLYPEHHGIVGNTFYDPSSGSVFSMTSTESHWWGGEPIWVTAELQGRSAATCFWVGSEAEIKGVRPSRWLSYDGSLSDAERVQTVLGWIDEPDPPALVTVYFSQVDSAGHSDGPDAPTVDTAVAEVDAALGMLLGGLEDRGILDETDVIVVSDHGMSQLSPERMIFLDDFIDTDADGTYILSYGAMVPIDVPEEDVEATLKALQPAEHLTCYSRDASPERWHHKSSNRISSVQCVADDGWSISTRSWFDRYPDGYSGGTHGYDPQDASMAGIFFARGPSFVQGETVPAFESVEVYNLLAYALGIEPADNDGDISRVEAVLR